MPCESFPFGFVACNGYPGAVREENPSGVDTRRDTYGCFRVETEECGFSGMEGLAGKGEGVGWGFTNAFLVYV